MLEVGIKAPDFELPDQNGKIHRLSDYTGKKVILYFYPRDNTPGCTKQACGFSERYPQFTEKGAVILGVSKDSVSSHKRFEEKYGLAFTLYMAPSVFEDRHFAYVQNHLRILSAFYGVLKPMDGVTPYRLEMQSRVGIGDAKNLYEYWGNLLYRSVIDDSRIIINLASKEYSKCIEKYLTPQDRYITITFCELSGNKLVTKGTYAKMARGEMVRFMTENNIENPVEIQKFDRIGYSFRSDLSSDSEYVFEREIEL